MSLFLKHITCGPPCDWASLDPVSLLVETLFNYAQLQSRKWVGIETSPFTRISSQRPLSQRYFPSFYPRDEDDMK